MELAQSVSKIHRAAQQPVGISAVRNEGIFLLVAGAAALLLRLLPLLLQEPTMTRDSAHYFSLAKKFTEGDFFGAIHPYWPPLYPFLVGAVSLVTRDLEFAGRFISIVAGTLLVVPTYLLIRDFYGRVPARFGTILIVIHPLLIVSSGWALTESLYGLIFTTLVLTGWKAVRRGRPRMFLITGLLLGAAYLTKPEAIGFVFLISVLTLGAKLFRNSFPFRSIAAGLFLLFCGFAIFSVPYILIIHQKTGKWTFSQKLVGNISSVEYERGSLELIDGATTRKDQVVGTDVPETRQPETGNSQPPQAWKSSGFNLKNLFRTTVHNLKSVFGEHLAAALSYPLILLAILGLFHRPWTKLRTAKETYLLSFIIATLLGYAVAVIQLRYLFALIPILAGWVSLGAVPFSAWASKSVSNLFRGVQNLNPFLIRSFALLVIFAAWLIPAIFIQKQIKQFTALPEKEAGKWLKSNKSMPALIMAANPLMAFYAGGKNIFFPNADFQTVLEYARSRGVNYLVISTENLAETPKLTFPDEQFLPSGLNLLYKSKDQTGYEIYIYQLSDTTFSKP